MLACLFCEELYTYDVKQHRRGGCSPLLAISSQQALPHIESCLPSHHETCKVGHMKLILHINRYIYAKANEGEQKPRRYERKPQPSKITGEGKYKKHHSAGNIGRHRIQVCLDSSEPQSANNLRQKQLHGLQWNTQADLDAQD